MRSPATHNILAFLAIGLFAISGTAAFGQGKGHGGGGKGNQGGGQAQRGGPPAGRPQMQRPQPQMQRPQAQMQRPQPQFQRPQPQHQRPQPAAPGWQMGRVQDKGRGRIEQARPQPQVQGWRIEQPRSPKGRAEVRIQPQPQYNPRQWQQQGNGRGKNGYPAPGLLGPPIKDYRGKNNFPAPGSFGQPAESRAWPNNYGYQRSTEAHLRNAERKAFKDEGRIAGSYYRGYYRPTRVDVRRFDAWHDNILRSVVSSAFTVNTGNYYSPYYADNYAYTTQYYPQGYNSGYYPAYQQYQVYQGYPAYAGTVTYYNFYDPYDYSYSSYGYSAPNYSDYYVDDIGLPNYYADDIGLPYISASSSFGGFVSRFFGEMVAFGYNQGYQDALYARSHARRTRYYYEDPYDPYVLVREDVVDDVGYNPYSCIAEDRRYVSQGYELGYRDALYGTADYDPYYNGGDIDLVSAMISVNL